jgi:hypothetical protein
MCCLFRAFSLVWAALHLEKAGLPTHFLSRMALNRRHEWNTEPISSDGPFSSSALPALSIRISMAPLNLALSEHGAKFRQKYAPQKGYKWDGCIHRWNVDASYLIFGLLPNKQAQDRMHLPFTDARIHLRTLASIHGRSHPFTDARIHLQTLASIHGRSHLFMDA